jgi:hypothetical protein
VIIEDFLRWERYADLFSHCCGEPIKAHFKQSILQQRLSKTLLLVLSFPLQKILQNHTPDGAPELLKIINLKGTLAITWKKSKLWSNIAANV